MSRNLVVVLLAATGIVAAAPAHAQDEPARASSIAIRVGESVGFGVWRNLGTRMAVGLEGSATFDRLEGDDVEQEVSDFTVEPALKLYGASGDPVRSYLFASVFYRRGTSHETNGNDDESEIEQTELGGSVGWGLEWFPVSRVSVGGHVGLRGGNRNAAQLFQGPFGDEEVKADGLFLRTFSSGIRVHFYF